MASLNIQRPKPFGGFEQGAALGKAIATPFASAAAAKKRENVSFEELKNAGVKNLNAGRIGPFNSIFELAYRLYPEETRREFGDRELTIPTTTGRQVVAFSKDDDYAPTIFTYNSAGEEVNRRTLSGYSGTPVSPEAYGARSRRAAIGRVEGAAAAKTPKITEIEDMTIRSQNAIDKKFVSLKTDKEYSSALKSLNGISRVVALLDGNTAGSQGFIRRSLLEASGEDRFTDQDIDQMKGPQDVKSRLKRFLKEKADGTMTKSDIAALKEMLAVLKGEADKILKTRTGSVLSELALTGQLSQELIDEIIAKKIALDLGTPVSPPADDFSGMSDEELDAEIAKIKGGV